jgi:[acyl-carrier-protein] S-malonyltransferase
LPKIAFMFPGQGSQYPGMGRDLREHFACAQAVWEEADRAMGFSLSRLCFEGPAEELQLTANTQPAILAVSVAAAEILKGKGIRPSYVAGHSLGEYSALVAVGAIRLKDALRLVRKRGQYMQEAVPKGEGTMAALLGLEAAAVEDICQEAARGQVVSPANWNSPGQVVIAGETAAVERAVELAKAQGAKRSVLLKVSAPFHCALMRPAAERLAMDLDAMDLSDLSVPLVNNVDARLVNTSAEVRDGLKRQVTAPVRWEQSMGELRIHGADCFVEVGPGKVLAGLLRQIDRAATCLRVEDARTLDETLTRLANRDADT